MKAHPREGRRDVAGIDIVRLPQETLCLRGGSIGSYFAIVTSPHTVINRKKRVFRQRCLVRQTPLQAVIVPG